MTPLNPATIRRLNNLPQIPSVWEGDRRPLLTPEELEGEANGDCIVWVDGVEGVVRAMEVVAPDMGPEPIVRALLRAIEHPQSPAQPARPQKIVVRDREIQFYLRGVLQDLDIAIDYAPELPLIDELFRGLQEMANTRPPKLPPQYADSLMKKAYAILEEAPWEILADHDILSVEVNQWDIETLYACVLGMFGTEYGILFYRSVDSLRRFRAAAIARESLQEMEEAFLGQDCLFITFENLNDDFDEDEEDEDWDLADLPISEIEPHFGAIHPLEGMRPFLYEEEALVIYVALEAVHRFIKTYARQLAADLVPPLNKSFRIFLPDEVGSEQSITLKVATQPDLSVELMELVQLEQEDDEDDEDNEFSMALQNDLVPDDAWINLEVIPWERLESINSHAGFYHSMSITLERKGLPTIIIQTSRPKAKAMIDRIQEAGGLKGIAFSPGEDPLAGENFDLGILQTENGEMFLFGEFLADDPVHASQRKQWNQGCQKTHGYCGLVIAKGVTGASGGDPQLKDMMAFWEARSLSPQELGLGILQSMPYFDF